MTFGELIAAFGDYLRSLIPFVLVEEWEQGVKTRFGRIVRTCLPTNGLFGTGVHMFWPVVGGIIVQDTNISTMESDDQTLTTNDGETVVVALTLSYWIFDVGRFYRFIHDQDDTIQNVLESSVGRWVGELNWYDVEDEEDRVIGANLIPQVEKDVELRFENWGIRIDDLALHTLTKVRAFRLIS